MTDAFGMCAIAVRNQCQHFAISAAASAGVTDKPLRFQGFGTGRGRAKMVWLATGKIQRDRDIDCRWIHTSWPGVGEQMQFTQVKRSRSRLSQASADPDSSRSLTAGVRSMLSISDPGTVSPSGNG